MKLYRIESSHNVYVDDYKQGELSNINNYDLDGMIKAENPQQAIEKYFENVIGFDFDIKHANIEDGILYYSNLVDGSNHEASKSQKESWKDGRCILYSNHTSLVIYELNKVEL